MYPKKLWDKFKLDISEDYKKQYGIIVGIKKAFDHIINLFQIKGINLSNFPELEQTVEKFEIDNEEQIQEDIFIGTQQYKQLNVKQKEMIYIILTVTESNNNSNNCFYIDGKVALVRLLFTQLYIIYSKIEQKTGSKLVLED